MPSNTDPKTILLKGDPQPGEGVVAAAATVVPGQLVEQVAAGTYQPNASAATVARPLIIAREEDYTGGSIDTAYATGERMPYWHCRPGDEFWGFLEDEHAAVAIGGIAEAGAAGTFQALTAGVPLAVFLEAKAATGGPAVGTRIRMRAL